MSADTLEGDKIQIMHQYIIWKTYLTELELNF